MFISGDSVLQAWSVAKEGHLLLPEEADLLLLEEVDLLLLAEEDLPLPQEEALLPEEKIFFSRAKIPFWREKIVSPRTSRSSPSGGSFVWKRPPYSVCGCKLVFLDCFQFAVLHKNYFL